MSQQLGRVAVLMGGTSAEREVSLKSGAAILQALQNQGIDAIAFDPAEQPLSALVAQQVDRVFIALHGRGGEDGTVQGALGLMKIPYTGSGVLGSALAMDKVRSKHLFKAAKLATAPYVIAQANKEVDTNAIMQSLNQRVMVKPSQEGSSIGMAQACNAEQLQQALDNAFKYDSQVLIEQWITGREFTVAILNGKPLPVIEMTTPHGFYDYEAKYQANTTCYHCPADLSAEQTAQLQSMAASAFELVGATGWGRVDAMQDENGNFYLLEVNTVPGMTEKSLVPMAAKAQGITFAQLVKTIVEQTL